MLGDSYVLQNLGSCSSGIPVATVTWTLEMLPPSSLSEKGICTQIFTAEKTKNLCLSALGSAAA